MPRRIVPNTCTTGRRVLSVLGFISMVTFTGKRSPPRTSCNTTCATPRRRVTTPTTSPSPSHWSECLLFITTIRGSAIETPATFDPRGRTAHTVKSTSPTTENWLRKLCTNSMNNNTSDEDKRDTNYINNKYTNTYTRKLHNL